MRITGRTRSTTSGDLDRRTTGRLLAVACLLVLAAGFGAWSLLSDAMRNEPVELVAATLASHAVDGSDARGQVSALVVEAAESRQSERPSPVRTELAQPEPAGATSSTVGRVILPDGLPAVGCEVSFCECTDSQSDQIRALDADELIDSSPPGAVMVMADASGVFALPTAGEHYVIQARLAGHAWQFATWRVGDVLPLIKLARAKNIRGRVVDEQGHAVSKARVLRYQWYLRTELENKPLAEVLRLCGFQETVFSDAEGRFEFAYTNDVLQQVVCRADRFAEARTHVIEPDAELLIKCALPATLFGRVEDTTGVPVRGARIEPWTWGSIPNVGGKSAETNSNGEYTLDGALSGCLLVGAWAPGFGYVPQQVMVPAGGRTRVDLVVPKEDCITGRVVDTSHEPVAGVAVRSLNLATGITLAPAISEQDGSFALKLIAPGAPYELRLSKEGHREELVSVVRGGEHDLTVCIRRLGSLTFAVSSADDEDVRELKLRLYARDDPSLFAWAEMMHVEHESRVVAVTNGIARVDGLWPSTYCVEVRAAGFASQVLDQVEIAEGSTVPIPIKLVRGVTIDGVVIDLNGERVPGARVSRMDEFHDGRAILGCEAESSLTDASGTFRLRAVASARYSLTAQKPGFAPAYWLGLCVPDAGANGLRPTLMPTLVMGRGGSVSGTIKSRYPRADDCYVIKVYPLGVASALRAAVDRDGRFLVPGVPAGWVDVELEDQQREYIFGDTPCEQRRVLVADGETTTVAFDTSGDLTLRGTVTGVSRSVLLELFRVDGRDQKILACADYTRRDGAFEMRSLSPGRYVLAASAAQSGFGAIVDREVDLREDLQSLAIDLEPDHIAARVLATESDVPIAEAIVTVLDAEGDERVRVRTDAEGRFEIIGVPAHATIRITAAGRAAITLPARDPQDDRIALEPEAILAIVVVDDLGGPVRGAHVQLGGGPEPAAQSAAVSRADGKIEFLGLVASRWRVSAQRAWYHPWSVEGVTTAVGETTHVIASLARIGTLEIRVLSGDGQPAAGVAIALVGNAQEHEQLMPRGPLVTDAEGRLRVSLPVDSYAIFAGARQEVEARAQVEHGRVVAVELAAPPP